MLHLTTPKNVDGAERAASIFGGLALLPGISAIMATEFRLVGHHEKHALPYSFPRLRAHRPQLDNS